MTDETNEPSQPRKEKVIGEISQDIKSDFQERERKMIVA